MTFSGMGVGLIACFLDAIIKSKLLWGKDSEDPCQLHLWHIIHADRLGANLFFSCLKISTGQNDHHLITHQLTSAPCVWAVKVHVWFSSPQWRPKVSCSLCWDSASLPLFILRQHLLKSQEVFPVEMDVCRSFHDEWKSCWSNLEHLMTDLELWFTESKWNSVCCLMNFNMKLKHKNFVNNLSIYSDVSLHVEKKVFELCTLKVMPLKYSV